MSFPCAWRLSLCLLAGCSSIPEGRSAVDTVDVRGAEQLGADVVRQAMATRASPRFLGVAQGVVYDYAIFNRAVLARDVARVERRYWAAGYYEAQVRATRIHRISDDRVRVELVVEEGPRVTVSTITHEGWPDDVDLPALTERGLVEDAPFVEERFEAHAEALRQALRAGGYAWAQVDKQADVDVGRHEAYVTMTVEPGPLASFGETRIEGLREIPEARVRAHISWREGDRFSSDEIAATEQALLNLGVFGAVDVAPEVGEVPDASSPVSVVAKVQEADLRQVRLGGGVELNALMSDVHLRAGWEDRNFLGGMRRFSVDLRPGVVLYPLRINNWVAPEQPLIHGDLRLRFEQPGFPEARTTLFVAPSIAVDPVLLRADPNPDDPVLGYVDFGGALGFERHWFRRKLRLAVQQNIRYDVPFAYLGDIDPRLSTIFLGYPELSATVDLRDDRLRPHAGFFAETSLQVAAFGSGHDIRLTPQLRGYIPLGPDVTLALRGQLGLLKPFDYGEGLTRVVGGASDLSAEEVRDLQLLYFRGYFAGGAGTNRGYAPRSIGPHASTPFINPDAQANCIDPAQCLTATGGMTLWAASIELRFPIYEPLLGATFCDTADVAPAPFSFRARPHLSCGGGLRIDSPVGPIRADLGYRIPGAQVLTDDAQGEGNPGTIFGAPLGLQIGIGQAF